MMSSIPLEETTDLDGQVLQRITVEARKAMTRAADALEVSISIVSKFGVEVISVAPECSCSTGSCSPSRTTHELPIEYEGVEIARMILCSDGSHTLETALFEDLLEAVVREVTLLLREESLLLELSASWESLEAVYDISSDIRAFQTPGALLERILDRATSAREGLQAILWIQTGDLIEPLCARTRQSPINRTLTEGLVAKAIKDRATVVIHDRARIAALSLSDPELVDAVAICIAPIATREGLLGALEVWGVGAEADFDSRTVGLIQALALQAAMVVENEKLQRALLESERLKHEIDIGSRIQQTLLLGKPPSDFPGAEIAAMSQPSQRIDGDFYDFFEHSKRCLDVIVGDVMGKGIPAALLGAATKTSFSRAFNSLMSNLQSSCIPDPEQVVSQVHAEVTRQFIGFDSFATLCHARFDMDHREVRYVDCGHTRTIHLQQGSDECALLHGDNVPLGFKESEIYRQLAVPFEPGDVFLFYSDGLTEARNPLGEMFGESRLCERVCRYKRLAAKEIVQRIKDDIVAFSGSDEFSDDLTCVVVKISTQQEDEPITQTLMMTSEASQLRRLRAFVRNICDSIQPELWTEEQSDSLELAVNEAASNIIRHAYQGKSGQPIEIEARLDSEKITIWLRHSGRGFDPTRVEPPSFDGTRESGFGLFIIQRSVDEVHYAPEPNGMKCTRLIKQLKRSTQHGS